MKANDICTIAGEGNDLWRVLVTGDLGSFAAERLIDGAPSGWRSFSSASVLSPRAARQRLAEMLDQLVAAAARVALARQGMRSR